MAIKQSWGYVIPEINPQIGFGGLSYDEGLAPVNIGTSKAKKKGEFIKNMIGGEPSPAAGLLGLADLAVNTASDIADGIKPIDDSASLEQLQVFGNQSLTAGNTTDILNLYSPLYSMPQKRDKYDYGYLNDGKALGSIASSTLRGASSGAAAGSAILPGLGTIIGGIGGALVGWGSNLFKTQKNNNQATSAAEEYNEALDEAQQNYLNNIATANINMQQRNLRNQLASSFAGGGKIYIKPENKGKFTAAAKARGMGVQEFASKVLANKEDYSPLMVKRANFARNASRWNAFGGPLDNTFTNGVTMIGNGGTHEDNINGGVQMGIAPDGRPNLVEEGEVIYNDYVFSNRLKVPKAVRQKYKLRGETFADAFKQAQKESEERPNDPISKNSLDNIAMVLATAQEDIRANKGSNEFACGGRKYEDGTEDLQRYLDVQQDAINDSLINSANKYNNRNLSWLRYAEPAANVAAVVNDITGLTNKPYRYDFISPYTPIQAQTLGDYIQPELFDRNYWTNQALASQAATRRAVTNTARPSAAANLLAADYAAGLQLGQLARQGQEYNREQALKTAEFNRSTNQFNAQSLMEAAAQNAGNQLAYDQAALQQARMNVDETNATWGAKAQNLGALATSIANIGREADAYRQLNALIDSGVFGSMNEVMENLSASSKGLFGKKRADGGDIEYYEDEKPPRYETGIYKGAPKPSRFISFLNSLPPTPGILDGYYHSKQKAQEVQDRIDMYKAKGYDLFDMLAAERGRASMIKTNKEAAKKRKKKGLTY